MFLKFLEIGEVSTAGSAKNGFLDPKIGGVGALVTPEGGPQDRPRGEHPDLVQG